MTNNTPLETLSDIQQHSLNALIEQVYVDHATNIHLSQDLFESVKLLFKSLDSYSIKTALFHHFNQETQINLAKALDFESVGDIFVHYHDMHRLSIIFSSFSPQTQTQILQHLKTHSPSKFNQFQTKEVVREDSENVITHSATHFDSLGTQPLKASLTLFQSPQFTNADASQFAKLLIRQHSNPDLTSLGATILTTLKNKNLALSNKKAFEIYLKSYYFFDPLLAHLPALTKYMPAHIDPLLTALHAMPNNDWKIKVLNQLPHSALKIGLTMLKNHEKLQNQAKRKIYSTLLHDIGTMLALPEAKRIKHTMMQ